jgi:hypothetical protein
MNITQMREFLSYLSDDTLQRVERAAADETLVPNVTPEQRDTRLLCDVRDPPHL